MVHFVNKFLVRFPGLAVDFRGFPMSLGYVVSLLSSGFSVGVSGGFSWICDFLWVLGTYVIFVFRVAFPKKRGQLPNGYKVYFVLKSLYSKGC